jgi:hypothetical protein
MARSLGTQLEVQMLKPMHSVSQSNSLSTLAYFVRGKLTDTTPLTFVLIEQCLHPTFPLAGDSLFKGEDFFHYHCCAST